MNNLTVRNRAVFKRLTVVSFVFLFALTSAGCEPLRKKFTRQKKRDKQLAGDSIPVLEPIEYPAKVYTPLDRYKQSYQLWKAWNKELLDSVSGNESAKRQLYLLGQVKVQLGRLQELIPAEKQDTLSKSLAQLSGIESELQIPVASRSSYSMRSDLESIERSIRNEYAVSKIKDSIR